MIFLHWLLSNGGRERNEISYKGSLADEDDTQTSNTCTAHKVGDTTLYDENASQHVYIVLMALCNYPMLSLQTSVTTSHVTC